MRVALFGGTFDPVHYGHLRIACAAADAFALDRVLFAPVGRQPLKSKAPAAPFEDRMAMAALALADPSLHTAESPRGCFSLSSLDAPRTDGQPNYTVDTLAALAREYPSTNLFVLTGADSFLTMPSWRSPGQLLDLAEWIVVSRPDFPLAPDFPAHDEFSLTGAQRARIHLLPGVHENISATALREHLRAHPGDACPGLLPPSVAAYIHEHRLYR